METIEVRFFSDVCLPNIGIQRGVVISPANSALVRYRSNHVSVAESGRLGLHLHETGDSF